MTEIDDLGEASVSDAAVSAGGAPNGDTGVSASIARYLATRTDDVAGAVRSLSISVPNAGMWAPVTDAVAEAAALSPCRFGATLLLRRDRGRLSAVIAAETWSVTLIGDEAWIDVEWPSETWATALQGHPLRRQIDFPFLSDALMVRGHEPFGAYRRFKCSEGSGER